MADAKRNRLLANVVRVAREELADREADTIPHKLRPVARSTGKGLPAHLQKSLLDFIAVDDEFRTSLAERFGERSIDDPIAAAFLTDPEEANVLIETQLKSDDVDRLTLELEAATASSTDLEKQLMVAKKRIDVMRTRNEADLAEHATASRRARQGIERQLADSLRESGGLREERQLLEGRVVELSAAVSELRERLARREERSERRHHTATPDETPMAAGSLPSDPVDLAATLDDLERRLRFYRDSVAVPPEVGVTRQPIALPGGISPESPEALDSLLAQTPDTILIDGYNVAGAVSETLIGSRLGRDDVVARAEALKRGSPASEVIVVFDASDSGGRGGFRSQGDVLVEFEPNTTADDAIVDFVHAGIEQCVVITNDRELQNRSARRGCVVVFSTALISWTEHLNGKAI